MPVLTYRLYEHNRAVEARVERFLMHAMLALVTLLHLARERHHS